MESLFVVFLNEQACFFHCVRAIISVRMFGMFGMVRMGRIRNRTLLSAIAVIVDGLSVGESEEEGKTGDSRMRSFKDHVDWFIVLVFSFVDFLFDSASEIEIVIYATFEDLIIGISWLSVYYFDRIIK